MGRKSPNHIFSIKDRRTISPTHYAVNKALDRLRLRHNSSGSDTSRYAMNSNQDSKSFAEKVGDHARGKTIAGDHNTEDGTITIADSVHVLFNALRFLAIPEIQDRIQGIKRATASELDRVDEIEKLNNTVDTITAVKNKKIEEIKQDKDKVILKLEAENKKLKEQEQSVAKEKEAVVKEKTKLERDRQAAEKEYREKEAKLKKQQEEALKKEKKKVKEQYEGEVKAAKSRVESEKRKLEKEKDDAVRLNREFNTEVNRLTVYRDTLEERNEGLKEDVASLREKLRTLSAEMAVSATPFVEYKKSVQNLYQLIEAFATRFENVPQEVELVLEPLGTLGKLRQASGIFDYTSSSRTAVATSLRKAGVQNFISGQLDAIFKNKLLVGCSTNSDKHDEAILNAISAALSPDEEKVWRGITVRALNRLPQFSDIKKIIAQLVEAGAGMLEPLIGKDEQTNTDVREQFAEIINAALKIWSLRRNDRCTITFNRAPGLKVDDSWKEWTVDEGSMLPGFSFPSNGTNRTIGNGNGSGSGSNGPQSPTYSTLQSSVINRRAESYVILPQIIGEFDTEDEGSDKDSKPKPRRRMILHPGIALFSDSTLFDKGLQDMRSLKSDVLGLHHRRRVSSLSASTTFPNNSGTDHVWLTQPYPQNSSGEPAGGNA
ncbi:hypothetical protein BDDG_01829 [Blastomyces dermatitidis ATCC 18188]|uniref:Uncharacterized protein n=1 Tax=Ajellomyces dermatitidis (strain ATCC 18188 / CBS 674.68) TaxID=653446 RepID=F2T6S8_AJEDA|nr:hypothetical protein BDDG_01829 [Blastomyces dermatitidis ATCC 18188]